MASLHLKACKQNGSFLLPGDFGGHGRASEFVNTNHHKLNIDRVESPTRRHSLLQIDGSEN